MQKRGFQPGYELKRMVVKLGTGILTSGIGQLDFEVIQNICQQISEIRKQGVEVILVSSGAVGLGMGRLGLTKRPSDLAMLQACASVGQSILIETWQKAFDPYGLHVGQILLTREDLSIRKRHVAVKETIDVLLKKDIIPVINENDCISVDELKFGDNDVLSSLVASLSKSDLLVLLSTIPGLMNLDTGELISQVEELNEDIMGLAQGTSSPTAVGGMVSKLNAVHIATGSKCGVFIAHGKEPGILNQLIDGQMKGTVFLPRDKKLRSHKRWLAYFHVTAGSITVDKGARKAIEEDGSSLLAAGVTQLDGSFSAGEVIDVKSSDDQIIARGITKFSAEALSELIGKSSTEIQELYPHRKSTEVIHRDELALLDLI